VADTARKSFLLGNEFEKVDQPILDWGARTLQRGNSAYSVDLKGEHRTPLPDAAGEREMKAWSAGKP
jgi:hypothetical protein